MGPFFQLKCLNPEFSSDWMQFLLIIFSQTVLNEAVMRFSILSVTRREAVVRKTLSVLNLLPTITYKIIKNIVFFQNMRHIGSITIFPPNPKLIISKVNSKIMTSLLRILVIILNPSVFACYTAINETVSRFERKPSRIQCYQPSWRRVP